ncbi:MAG: hypothetical protein PHD87_06005 [Candidatus Cloacimonetes bacterium]|nr:hypothetical protein [Candidatus Cloacimonadota bacterium]
MRVFIFAFIAILAAGALSAEILTLDNNLHPTGQYTTWIAAYNAASDGDIIYVYPSPYDYGPAWNQPVRKSLTVIGGGFNPANPDLLTSKISPWVDDATGAGSVFSGIHLCSNVNNSHQVTYENCRFDTNVTLQASGSELRNCWCSVNVFAGNGVHISGCTLQGYMQPALGADVTCSNCVFIGNVTHIDTGGNNNLCCYFNNCLFANVDDGTHILRGGWGSPIDLHFINCIMEVITIPAAYDFQYCIYEGSSAYITDPSNMQNVDLALVMEDVNGGDYHLVPEPPANPAIGAGFNGEDIGIYGGDTPFNDLWYLTSLPSITGFTCPIVIDENGFLNVHIEAQAGN